jgi:hypothetical protein
MRRGEAERACLRADLSFGLKLQRLGGLLHRAEMRQEAAEQLRGAEPARMPVEERAAKGVFRRADLSAEGGLADTDLPRRRGEGAVIGHGQHSGRRDQSREGDT